MKKKILLTLLALVTICAIYFGIQIKGIFDIMGQAKLEQIEDISPNVELDLEDEHIISDANNDTKKIYDNNIDSSANIKTIDSENNNDDLDTVIHEDDFEEKSKEKDKSVDNSVKEKPATEKMPASIGDNALQNTKDKTVNEEKQKENSNTIITADKINNVENNISLADKAKAVKLILTSLSSSDIKALAELASGGLTAEEKRKAIELAYSRYSEEEIEIIKALYNKYIR